MNSKTRSYKEKTEFSFSNKGEVHKYIIETLKTKENYLVGQVGGNSKGENGSNCFVIENLINPFTGKEVKEIFSEMPLITTAIFKNRKYGDLGLKFGEIILFQFISDVRSKEDITATDILVAKPGSVVRIQYEKNLFDKLQVSVEDLNISGTLSTLDENNVSFYFSNNIYKEIIEQKISREFFDITNKEKEIAKKEEVIAKKEEVIKKEKKEIFQERRKLFSLDEEIFDISQRLKELGFSINYQKELNKNKVEKKPLDIPSEEQDIVKGIQQSMAQNQLYYEESIVRRFYTALKTNQFIILSGPSGTGKTSLISAFSEAISASFKIIPVQPSWVDRQDLLGFYNPLTKQFVPTAFLNALEEARNNPSKLYFICLDELNLAQIEYYLADILSVKEQRNSFLELYSQYEYNQAMEEISWYVQKLYKEEITVLDEWSENLVESESMEQIKYIQRYNNMKRYPASFSLPKNIRFIGTMNVDGSVRSLSPKVIDRCFVIELPKQQKNLAIASVKGNYQLSPAYFELPERKATTLNYSQYMNKLNKIIQSLQANYNNRVENHLKLYALASETQEVDSNKLADELLVMKVLPRINYLIDGSKIEDELLKQVKEIFGEQSLSYKKVQSMIVKSQKNKIFSYWG